MSDDHSHHSEPPRPDAGHDPGVQDVVRDGYNLVYDALQRSDTFNRIWRTTAYRGEFPAELAHLGFLTLAEARRLLTFLDLAEGDVLVDVACGAGGPGLWVAGETGASLVGIDPSEAGLQAARRRAARVGLVDRARFQSGSFARTGLPDDAATAVMTIDAFQYAPDKRAAMAELVRVLRPGGRIGIVCFEVDPTKVEGVPALGVGPVADYASLLEAAGLTVAAYEETPGWEQRVDAAFVAIIDAADVLAAEMGQRAAAAVLSEASLTLEVRPYRRRILAAAAKPT